MFQGIRSDLVHQFIQEFIIIIFFNVQPQNEAVTKNISQSIKQDLHGRNKM